MARGPFSDQVARQWQWLLGHGNDREKALLHRLYAEPTIRFYCPYPTSNEMHLSRNTAYPWDDKGLPFVVAEADGTYVVRSSDGSVSAHGTVEDVVVSLLALLEGVPRPRRSDSRQKDLTEACDRAWHRLATSSDPEIRVVAERLFEEPEARRYYPYTSHQDVRLSRNEEYPWDDEGLPWLLRGQGDPYSVLDGEHAPRGSGDLATAVAVFVRLLVDIRTSTHDFQDVFREALHRGTGDLYEIVGRYKRLGLGQREAYEALEALREGLPEPVEDLLLEVMDVVSGFCSPHNRIWEASLRD